NPWKDRLLRMRRYRDKNSKTWERNRRLLFGEDEGDPPRENTFSFGWSLVKSLETSIYVQNPEMVAEPYDGNAQVMGMQMGRLLTSIANYDIDQMDLKSLGNIGLVDCFVNGFFACIETIETETSTVRFPDSKEDEKRPEEQEFAAYRIPPKDFLIDPKCRKLDLSDADYCAVAFYPTIAALKEGKNQGTYPDLPSDVDEYPEASAEKAPSGPFQAKTARLSSSSTGGEKDPDYKTICIWEI